MAYAVPQSVAKVVVFQAFLTDGTTPATGKTIAVTISKNAANTFSNPAAGATNATEMLQGWYSVSLGTGDFDTLGPLLVYGSCAGVDPIYRLFYVVNPHNANFDGVPNLTASGAIAADIKKVNAVTVTGNGSTTPWGPA